MHDRQFIPSKPEQTKPGFHPEEIIAMYAAGMHIAAIKALRAETGCDLSEAVNALREGMLNDMPTFKAYRVRKKSERYGPHLFAFAQRVGALNRDAGEIGPGMLASLVDDARALIAEIEKE